MKSSPQEVKVRRLGPDQILNVKISYTKEFKARLFLAKFFITCAAKVLGAGINIDEDVIVNDKERIEKLVVTLVELANFMRGMQFDPDIPRHAKGALARRVEEVDKVTAEYGE